MPVPPRGTGLSNYFSLPPARCFIIRLASRGWGQGIAFVCIDFFMFALRNYCFLLLGVWDVLATAPFIYFILIHVVGKLGVGRMGDIAFFWWTTKQLLSKGGECWVSRLCAQPPLPSRLKVLRADRPPHLFCGFPVPICRFVCWRPSADFLIRGFSPTSLIGERGPITVVPLASLKLLLKTHFRSFFLWGPATCLIIRRPEEFFKTRSLEEKRPEDP